MATNMSKKDEDAIAAAGAAWNEAKARGDQAGMDAAHAQAEAIRNNYGYSGGDDGSQYISSSGGSSSSRGSGSSGGGSSYTPKDNSGNDYAGLSGMSDLHKEALAAAGTAWNEAKARGDQAGMDAAHAKAEAIRKLYDYSGGGDGSEYIPIPKQQGEFTFDYGSAPSYVNRYQDQIDAITKDILNREAFSYDPEQDDLYKQYKESYTRNGEQAMKNTLGQVSARTGGLASSYATTAAQQTYDGYMSALADKIPELKQLAYSMYQDEGNTQRANLEMLIALENGDYAKYADLLAQWNTDRNFNYGAYRDSISDSRYDNEWDYSVGRDQISDKRYEDETAYDRGLTKAQLLAQMGDFSGYKELGYSDDEVKRLQSAYEQALAQESTKKSTSGLPKTRTGSGDYESLFAAAQESGYPQSFIANNYKKYGFSSSTGLYGDYSKWAENGGGDSGSDAQIGNRHGDSWIYIPGHGRFTYDEVENYVNSGKVIETYDSATNTYTYKWNGNKK